MVIVSQDEAGRAQAVTVQRGADLTTIGEGNGGRTVPWLHQGSVIFIEGLALGIHLLIAGPGFWDQHHHGMGERIATGQQQFQSIVEASRIGLTVWDQWPHLVEVGTQ